MALRRTRRTHLLLAGLASLVAAAVTALVAAPDLWADGAKALQLLRDSMARSEKCGYEGDRELRHGPEQTVVRREHVLIDVGRRERIEVVFPPRHQGDLSVSDGVCRWRYTKASNTVEQEALRPPVEVHLIAVKLTELLGQNFDLVVKPPEPIADRPADVIEVRAKGSDRVVERLWLDREHGVTLKLERRRAGDLALVSCFTRIVYGPTFAPGTFTLATTGMQVRDLPAPPRRLPLDAAQRQAGFPIYVPPQSPAGYERMPFLTVQVPDGQTVVVMRYHNGLEYLSLFQMRARPGAPPPPAHDAEVITAGPYQFVLKGPKEARAALRRVIEQDARRFP